MLERMNRASEIDWSDLVEKAEKAVDFLLRKKVAVYIKIDRGQFSVYRHHRVKVGEDELPMPFVGFVEEASFLPLGNAGLAEIAVCGSHRAYEFSGSGFRIPRPFDTAETIGGRHAVRHFRPIETAELAPFGFDRAILIDKRGRDKALKATRPIDAPPVEAFSVSVEVKECDLYITGSDLARLREEVRQKHQAVDYPFEHKDRMPGLYWIFQAAFLLNEAKAIQLGDVKEWLIAKSRLEVLEGKRGDFATKLTAKTLHRSQGRKGGARPLKIHNLLALTEHPERLVYPFASDGLTLLLGFADWWENHLVDDPNLSRFDLAKVVYAQNFDKVETGYVVRLIAGDNLSKAEKPLFEKWATQWDQNERMRLAKSALAEGAL